LTIHILFRIIISAHFVSHEILVVKVAYHRVKLADTPPTTNRPVPLATFLYSGFDNYQSRFF